jgi:uncharacterized membrane protein YkvA (DUF1232 family)
MLRPPRLRRRIVDPRDASSLAGIVTTLGDLAALGKLILRLARDPRVSRLDKLLLAGAAAYVVLPSDLIPDHLPVIGQLDDVLLVVLALHRLLERTDPEVLFEHWDGDPAMLEGLLAGVGRVRRSLAASRPLLREVRSAGLRLWSGRR